MYTDVLDKLMNRMLGKTMKKFALTATDIKPRVKGYGGCIATELITVQGYKVGYMYRDHPHNPQDSGWRFMAGIESPQYMENAGNHAIYDVNTIANYDPDIIPLLDSPIGATYERDEEGDFIPAPPFEVN